MIPQAYITAWRRQAPWRENYQVEQDLIIHRSIIEIFSDDFLRERLVFRGGTALYKMYLSPAARYSEDIDLVQIKAEPFGTVIDKIRERLLFLGNPRIYQKLHNNTLVYRMLSEDNVPVKLKIEVNTREHFTVFGIRRILTQLDSEWSNGKSLVSTYSLEELLATKLRALYQRKKGRDLFDLRYAINQTEVDIAKVVTAFKRYMQEEGLSISQKEFTENLERKVEDKDFVGDVKSLLRSDINYDAGEARETIQTKIIRRL